MQCHNHINCTYPVIIGNIPLKKFQFFIPVFLSQTAAVQDHIFFQIQSDYLYVIVFQFMQIIIHCKSKVRFPAAKIQNCKFPVPVKLRKNIPDKLQKSVNLSEFVHFGCNDLSLFRHDTQIFKKRDIYSFLQYVFFLPVVRQIRRLSRRLPFLPLYRDLALFACQNGYIFRYRFNLHLAESFHIFCNYLFCLSASGIFVECLCLCK